MTFEENCIQKIWDAISQGEEENPTNWLPKSQWLFWGNSISSFPLFKKKNDILDAFFPTFGVLAILICRKRLYRLGCTQKCEHVLVAGKQTVAMANRAKTLKRQRSQPRMWHTRSEKKWGTMGERADPQLTFRARMRGLGRFCPPPHPLEPDTFWLTPRLFPKPVRH